MSKIVATIKINRPPQVVFEYASVPANLPEWQESVISAELEVAGPATTGSRIAAVRKMGPGKLPVTFVITEFDAPNAWTLTTADPGPVTSTSRITVEPADGGSASQVTAELDLQGHGAGKVMVKAVARPQAKKEVPQNLERLKELLES